MGWVDVFTNKHYKFIVIDSLKYCQLNKGLVIFGYCIMSNHIHMIARAEGEMTLSDILRDFKKYTSKAIIKAIAEIPESRKSWMLSHFKVAGKNNGRDHGFKFWQDGNHTELIQSNKFFNTKLDYIHNNPVKELIVERPEEYLFSSARNYAGLSNYLDIVLESVQLRTYR
jgi:REP element-mobilizing transposase RayT